MRVLLFDLMDTLVHDNYMDVVLRTLPPGHTPEQYRSWRDRRAFEEFERGEISEDEYMRRYYKPETPPHILDLYIRPQRVKKELFRAIHWLSGIPDLLDAVSVLPDVKLGLASNYGAWYQELFAKRPDLPDRFHYLFFSCEMGQRKPSPEYYAVIEESLKRAEGIADGSDIFFTDDRQANLEVAQERGWVTHLMRGADDLRLAIDDFMAPR